MSHARQIKTHKPLPTVGQYCRAIGVTLKHYNEWKKGDPCPFCRVKTGFLIRPDCGAFKCRECGAQGNGIIQLHMELHGINYGQALNQLAALAEAGS